MGGTTGGLLFTVEAGAGCGLFENEAGTLSGGSIPYDVTDAIGAVDTGGC